MRPLLRFAFVPLACLAAASPAYAGRLLDLAVVDRDTGATLPTYAHDGRLYVAGAPGHRYAVRLTNRSGARVLAVLSVDGVNAVSGETADPHQSGYVLDAWQSTEIAGWRKSLDEVAAFEFTALADSYAARTGRAADVGVIGVAAFAERPPLRPVHRDEIARAEAKAARAPASAAAPASEAAPAPDVPRAAGAATQPSPRSVRADRLGTGHGEREYAHADATTFERATRDPAETLAIWYDRYESLAARGIVPRPLAHAEPRPFPGGFVPDPSPR